eukprot:s2262_g7.t1
MKVRDQGFKSKPPKAVPRCSALSVIKLLSMAGWIMGRGVTSVDSAVSWLVENADPRQPQQSQEYLRQNAHYALKARSEIPVAREVPEENALLSSI